MEPNETILAIAAALAPVLTLIFAILRRLGKEPKASDKQLVALIITAVAGALVEGLTGEATIESALAGSLQAIGAVLATYWGGMKGARIEKFIERIVFAIIGPPPMPPSP